MPEWIIVGNDPTGEPLVLCGWIFTNSWRPLADVKAGEAQQVIFRDRWRAKRQYRHQWREYTPRVVRASRL